MLIIKKSRIYLHMWDFFVSMPFTPYYWAGFIMLD